MAAKPFRHFNPLIDLAFWLFILSFSAMLAVRFFTGLPPGLVRAASALIFYLGYATWLLTVFLICARFMRDEYAEGLWQKSAAKFTFVLVLLPMALLVFFWIYQAYAAPLATQPTAAEKAALDAYPHPSTWQLSGALHLLHYIASYVPFLFIALYKWNRWRDA
jgi:hypothetical protein